MNLFSFQKTCLSLPLTLVTILLLQLIILCRCHLQQQQRLGNAEYLSRRRRTSVFSMTGSRSQQYDSRKCPPSESIVGAVVSPGWPRRNGSTVSGGDGDGIINRCDKSIRANGTSQGSLIRNRRRGNNGKQARTGTIDQDSRPKRHRHTDLSLWIDEHQVRLLSGNSKPKKDRILYAVIIQPLDHNNQSHLAPTV